MTINRLQHHAGNRERIETILPFPGFICYEISFIVRYGVSESIKDLDVFRRVVTAIQSPLRWQGAGDH